MARTVVIFPLGAALLLLIGPAPTAEAGGRHQRPSGPVVIGAPVTVASPTASRRSLADPTVASSPYLGTFRPDPTLIVRSGYATGGGYSPAGLPTAYGTMSLYGPFSRLRSVPNEVVTYSRGYDGVLRPTSTAISYDYPDPRLYPDTTLLPTGMRVDPATGARVRSGFGRYLLGQE